MAGASESKGMKRQRKAVEAEIEAAGLTLSSVEAITPEGAGGIGKSLKSAFAATVGGSLKNESFHIYDIQGASGSHQFVQPYSGTVTLPGEHRAEIEGSTTATFKVVQPWLGHPDNLRLIIFAGMFTCGLFWVLLLALGWRHPKVVCEDPALQARLRANPAMKRALSGLKFQWGVGLGVIELEWAVQVRPLGNGRSEVIMATGRYGGFTTYKVGMKKFNELVSLMPQALSKETAAVEEQFFLEPIRFPYIEPDESDDAPLGA